MHMHSPFPLSFHTRPSPLSLSRKRPEKFPTASRNFPAAAAASRPSRTPTRPRTSRSSAAPSSSPLPAPPPSPVPGSSTRWPRSRRNSSPATTASGQKIPHSSSRLPAISGATRPRTSRSYAALSSSLLRPPLPAPPPSPVIGSSTRWPRSGRCSWPATTASVHSGATPDSCDAFHRRRALFSCMICSRLASSPLRRRRRVGEVEEGELSLAERAEAEEDEPSPAAHEEGEEDERSLQINYFVPFKSPVATRVEGDTQADD